MRGMNEIMRMLKGMKGRYGGVRQGGDMSEKRMTELVKKKQEWVG